LYNLFLFSYKVLNYLYFCVFCLIHLHTVGKDRLELYEEQLDLT
jgi:hypothetical protein